MSNYYDRFIDRHLASIGATEHSPRLSDFGEYHPKKKLVGICKSKQCNAGMRNKSYYEGYKGTIIFEGNNGKNICPKCGDAIFWKWIKAPRIKEGAE